MALALFVLRAVLLLSLLPARPSGQGTALTRTRRQLPVNEGCTSMNWCQVLPVCKNGGTCVFNCTIFCLCPPDFTGKACGTPIASATSTSTLATTSPASVTSQTSIEDVTQPSTPDAATSSRGSNVTSNVTSTTATTLNAVGSVSTLKCDRTLCQHGECDAAALASEQILCVCQDGYSGDFCEQRCSLDCGQHGICRYNGTHEVCNCQKPYISENNVCIFRPEEEPHENRHWLWVVVACAVVLALLLVVLVALPYWLWRKREVFIMKVVYFFQPYEDEDGKLFDAFVSYVSSPRDEAFVYRRLFPKLERELGFKLCLHHRDFRVGETICNNIIWAVQNSRRTLLILSPAYLKSEFTRFEYQEAQREMLRLKHRIVPVMLEDVEPLRQSMDPTLKAILASITYIRWPVQSPTENHHQLQQQQLQGDAEEGHEKHLRKFWKRLELSLPKKKRQPESASVAVDCRTAQNQQDHSLGRHVTSSPEVSDVTAPPPPRAVPPKSEESCQEQRAPPPRGKLDEALCADILSSADHVTFSRSMADLDSDTPAILESTHL